MINKDKDDDDEFDVVIKITNTDNFRMRPQKASPTSSMSSAQKDVAPKTTASESKSSKPKDNKETPALPLTSIKPEEPAAPSLLDLTKASSTTPKKAKQKSLPTLNENDVRNLLIFPLFGYVSRDYLIDQIVVRKKTVEQALESLRANRYASYVNAKKAFKKSYPRQNITDFKPGYKTSVQIEIQRREQEELKERKRWEEECKLRKAEEQRRLEEKKKAEEQRRLESFRIKAAEERLDAIKRKTSPSEMLELSEDKTILISCPKEGIGSVQVPSGVLTIGKEAFAHCKRITGVEFSNTVTRICDSAFEGCSKMKRLNITEGISFIGKNVFDGEFNVKPNNKFYSSYEGSLLSSDGSLIYSVPKEILQIRIPHTVNVISDGAFSNCKKIVNIVLPGSVTEIEDFAFSGCSSLYIITLPESVRSIGQFIFSGCTQLKEVFLKISDPCGIFHENSFVSLRNRETTVHVPEGCLFSFTRHKAFVDIKVVADLKNERKAILQPVKNEGLTHASIPHQEIQDIVEPWTEEEDAILLECLDEGASIESIADLLDHTVDNVRERLDSIQKSKNNHAIKTTYSVVKKEQNQVEPTSEKKKTEIEKALDYYLSHSQSCKDSASGRSIQSNELVYGNFVIKKKGK